MDALLAKKYEIFKGIILITQNGKELSSTCKEYLDLEKKIPEKKPTNL
jgi:hypothetical protein